MKNIFKLMSLLLMVCFMTTLISACGQKKEEVDLLQKIKERGKLVVGVKFDSKPFGFIDSDQQLKGFDVELVKEIAYRILGDREAVEFKQVNASNRIFSLTSGAIDMVAATMTITEKRKNIVDFSNPYYIAGQAIMAPKKSDIHNAKDLNGKRVIVVLGSTSEKNVRLLAPKAIIKGFRTYTEAYSALKAGRADVMTTDDTILAGFIMEDPSFKMLKGRFTKEPYGLGFRKGPSSQNLKRVVNIALEGIKADGTLRKITRKWMGSFSG